MTRVTHNKLVRDLIPQHIESKGERAVTVELSEVEFKAALLKKLVEEAGEVEAAKDKDLLLAELADVAEVLEAIYKTFEINPSTVKLVAEEKKATKGAFTRRLYLKYTE